jgi:hypothetical protein
MGVPGEVVTPVGVSARIAGSVWFVTFVTVGELWQGADARSWGRQTRDELDDFLAHTVVIDSDDGVSPNGDGRLPPPGADRDPDRRTTRGSPHAVSRAGCHSPRTT